MRHKCPVVANTTGEIQEVNLSLKDFSRTDNFYLIELESSERCPYSRSGNDHITIKLNPYECVWMKVNYLD